jgi:hypothetical protein
MTTDLGMEKDREKELIELLRSLADTTHGNSNTEKVKTFFKAQKTPKPMSVLAQLMHSEPIRWLEIGESLWPDQTERDANRFYFVQGDLIVSTKVERPGVSPINQRHNLWLVKSPTCDAVRATYCQLHPVFKVYKTFKNGTAEEKTALDNLRLASMFMSPNLFPVAIRDEDDEEHLGSYADFRIPGFLDVASRADATVQCSLTVEGWHLLNMFIQQRETRATMSEELQMRSTGLESRADQNPPEGNVTPIRKSEQTGGN